MDNVFGIGLPEVVLILVIAGMVMGPERIARAARSLGLLTARLQSVSRSFFRQLNAELDSVDEGGELKSTVEELNLLRRQVADLRNEVFSITTGAATEGKRAISEIKEEAERTIMPPKPLSASRRLKPTPRDDAPPPDDAPVHRPPSLFGGDAAANTPDRTANGAPAVNPLTTLPKRIDVPDDPDE